VEARPELVGRLTRLLAQQSGASLPERLCAAFSLMVGADGAAITVGFAPADRQILCATNVLAERIEDLQDLLRQGPGLDAFRRGETTFLGHGDHGDWPLLVDALRDPGPVPAIHAFVMEPQETVMGVITVHTSPARELTADVVDGEFLADAVGVAILGQMAAEDWADERWAVRDTIAQATGMAVAQLQVTPADALAVLRAHAFSENATLSDVARRMVGRSLRLDTDQRAP
jgi:hypothetical protein